MVNSKINRKAIFISAAFLCITLFSNAALENGIVSKSGNGIVSTTSTTVPTLEIQDQWYPYSVSTGFGVKKSENIVTLRYDESKRTYDNSTWTLTVNYDIKIYNSSGTLINTFNHDLGIAYNPLTGYKDIDVLTYPNGFRAQLFVRTVTYNGSTVSPIPASRNNDIYLDLEQETERYYNLVSTTHPAVITSGVLTNNELPIHWDYLQGAESYDVEWLFIDIGTDLYSSNYNYDFRNATRINTSNQYYNIPMAFPKGIVLFRVRGVGNNITTFTDRTESEWSISNASFTGNTSSLTGLTNYLYRKNYTGLTPSFNWQYSATYAEKGKRKEVISYYDGSLHNRQSSTVISSDNNVVIAETKYDFEGRAAVGLLPTPFQKQGITFYQNFNPNFDKNDFDVDGNYDLPGALTTADETGKYYSPSNANSNGINAYIPDADGYAYSRTKYKQDGSNRVTVQSGVGLNHKIGSGHETKYFYGTPTQTELDRLFGNEVGECSHYKKNMVMDANGQLSISYLDQEGRVIATALAGPPPGNLLDIDLMPPSVQINTDLLVGKNDIAGDASTATTTIVVEVPQNYTFSYDLASTCYGETIPCPIVCTDCKYDLFIEVKQSDTGDHPTLAFSVQSPTLPDPALPTGTPTNPILFSNISAANYNFTVHLDVGTYIITKRVSLNLSNISIDAIVASLELPGNSACLNVPQVYIEPCIDGCASLCGQQYTAIVNGVTVYLDDDGNVVTDPTQITVIQGLLAQCILTCNNPTNSGPLTAQDPCTQKKMILIHDMSPGGQYFDNLNVLNNYSPLPANKNDWLENNVHASSGASAWFNTTFSPIINNWNDVRNNWMDSWGEILFPFHPEKCAWDYYCDKSICSLAQSNDYDQSIEADAEVLGAYCNPTSLPINTIYATSSDWEFYNNSLGSTVAQISDPYASLKCDQFTSISFPNCSTDVIDKKDAIDGLLKHYVAVGSSSTPIYMSIWYVLEDPQQIHLYSSEAVASAALGVNIPSQVFGLFRSLHGDGGSNNGMFGGAPPILTKYKYFKNFYEGTKSMIVYQGFKNHCGDNHNPVLPLEDTPIYAGSTRDGFQIRYLKNDAYELLLSNTCPSGSPPTLVLNDPTAFITAMDNFTQQSGNADMRTICQSTCEGYSQSWRNELSASCPYITHTEMDEMINYMLQICTNSCDAEHAQGLDNMADPGVLGPRGYLNTFAEVINAYAPPCSTGASIVHPPPTPVYNDAQCTCSNIHNFISNLPDGLNSSNSDIALALNEAYGITITSLDVSIWLYECGLSNTSVNSLTDVPANFVCPVNQYPDANDECQQQYIQATADAAFTYQQNIHAAALSRAQAFIENFKASCLSTLMARETFSMSYQLNEYYYTLYYYDQAGNLIKTVPPDGVRPLTPTSTPNNLLDVTNYRAETADPHILPFSIPSHSMVTHYKYNSLQQLFEQTTPDAGTSEFWYDAKGRLVVSQNAKQKLINTYSYTVYDELGRINQVGEITPSVNMDDATSRNQTSLNSWFANGSRSQITRTIYDNTISSVIDGYFGTVGQENLRNRVSSVTISEAVAGITGDPLADVLTNYDNATHYSYDMHGNVKTLIQENKSLYGVNTSLKYDLKYIDYEYDLVSGNVNKVSYQSRLDENGNPQPDRFYHRYFYDADNRITEAQTSFNNVIWEKEAKYFYYPTGVLARTEIGDKQVQGMDYAYTIEGWIKGVNSNTLASNRDIGADAKQTSVNLNANFGSDGMGYTIGYFMGDYKAINPATDPLDRFEAKIDVGSNFDLASPGLYNGNIRHIVNSFMDLNETPVPVQGKVYKYDQLNRIRFANIYGDGTVNSLNNFSAAGNLSTYDEEFHYDLNGNITRANRNGNISGSLAMDELKYFYWNTSGGHNDLGLAANSPAPANSTNKLAYVSDVQASGTYGADIDNQTSTQNYQYDAIGNLIKDNSEQIDNIAWTVYGKIKSITRAVGSIKEELEFKYDASGNRVEKIVKPRTGGVLQDQSNWVSTYYVRDASGNVLATYKRKYTLVSGTTYQDQLNVAEINLFGSSRLGVFDNRNNTINLPVSNFTASINSTTNLFNTQTWVQPSFTSPCTTGCYYSYNRNLGNKQYELSNHLGNVIASVSDRKLQIQSGASTLVAFYLPDVLSSQDYYSFGAEMPGRGVPSSINYRYGFNGKEKDDEVKGSGDSYDYGARMYDPRLGKWLATDPMQTKYADKTPYGFCSDNPTNRVDPDGRDDIHFYTYQKSILINGESKPLGGTVTWYTITPNNNPNTYTLHNLTTQIGIDNVQSMQLPDIKLTGVDAGNEIIRYGLDKLPQYQVIEEIDNPASRNPIACTAAGDIQNKAAFARRKEFEDNVNDLMFGLIAGVVTDGLFSAMGETEFAGVFCKTKDEMKFIFQIDKNTTVEFSGEYFELNNNRLHLSDVNVFAYRNGVQLTEDEFSNMVGARKVLEYKGKIETFIKQGLKFDDFSWDGMRISGAKPGKKVFSK